jgi:hypothetical protein
MVHFDMLLLLWSLSVTWAVRTHMKDQDKTAQDSKSLYWFWLLSPVPRVKGFLRSYGVRMCIRICYVRWNRWLLRVFSFGPQRNCILGGHMHGFKSRRHHAFRFMQLLVYSIQNGPMVRLLGTMNLAFVHDGPIVPGHHVTDPNQRVTGCTSCECKNLRHTRQEAHNCSKSFMSALATVSFDSL